MFEFQWLQDLPRVWAKAIAVMLFLGIGVIAWLFPRDYVYHDAPDMRTWRDIRVWASAILLIQAILYIVF